MDITLPWWAWAYLVLVLGVYAASFFSDEDVQGEFDRDDIISSSISLFCICVFVVGFFNSSVTDFLGFMVIPMVGVGVFWEFTRAVRETGLAQRELDGEQDLTDGERRFLLNIAVGFNAVLVVPGYMVGVLLAANAFQVILGA